MKTFKKIGINNIKFIIKKLKIKFLMKKNVMVTKKNYLQLYKKIISIINYKIIIIIIKI
jgi:hypothetical protein